MISKRSCDTENWSNDEENSALHHRNNITFYNILKLKTFLICNYISQYCFFFFFNQINSALMSRRYLFQNHNVSKLLAGTLIIITILYTIYFTIIYYSTLL